MPQIEVNETNIDLFGLVEMTENSRETLLNEAANARMKGMTLTVNVPDDLIHLNIFDMAEDEPAPIADALAQNDRCRYERKWTDEVGDIWVCIIHGNNSKHDVLLDPKAPCLMVDPY